MSLLHGKQIESSCPTNDLSVGRARKLFLLAALVMLDLGVLIAVLLAVRWLV
ncbi:hypothetical protein BJY04DRAFT_176612 [Aspergillus karnatakaensis]|uniref:uncharacterized protein n=1 Tax=Aspergillus karnatakaensis TaxID=1810916 RepID=UPI003CCCEBBA